MATNIGYISTANGTNFLILSNGEFLRRVDTSWNKIRIGIRMGMREFTSSSGGPTSAGNLLGMPRLYIGMCNFNKGGIGAKNSNVHFVGVRTASSTWNRTTGGGPSANVNYFSSAPQALKREFNSYGTGTVSGSTFIMPIFAPSNYCMLSVDIDKANPTTTVVSIFGPSNAATSVVNISSATFLTTMESATQSITGYASITLAPISINEGLNGALDSVNIFWSRSRAQVYIADVWYSVLA